MYVPILSLMQALPRPVTKRQRKLSVGLNWCLEKPIHHLGWAMMKSSKNTYTISCWVSKEMMNFCPFRNKDFPYLFILVKHTYRISSYSFRPWILSSLEYFPHLYVLWPLALCNVTFRFPSSKKNSFRRNYMRKYGR